MILLCWECIFKRQLSIQNEEEWIIFKSTANNFLAKNKANIYSRTLIFSLPYIQVTTYRVSTIKIMPILQTRKLRIINVK